jgi:hypothetical protein
LRLISATRFSGFDVVAAEQQYHCRRMRADQTCQFGDPNLNPRPSA